MDIDEIHDLWSVDCKIDDLELDQESLKIPQLHSKYMRIITEENSILSMGTVESQGNEERCSQIH